MNWKAILKVIILMSATVGNISKASSLTETWYLMRGRANMKIENYKAAVEAYEMALRQDPSNSEANRGLGLSLFKMGQYQQAKDKLLKALLTDKKSQGDDDVKSALSQICTTSKNTVPFETCYKITRDHYNQNQTLPNLRVLANFLSNHPQSKNESLHYFRMADEHPEATDEDRANFRNRILGLPSYRAEAIAKFRAHIQRNPSDREASIKLAELLASTQNGQVEAAKIIDKISSQQNRPKDLELKRARYLTSLSGNQNEAASIYRSILKKDQNASMEEEFGDLQARSEATREEAISLYENSLRKNMGNQKLRLKLGKILLADRGNQGKAIDQFKYILKTNPNNAAAQKGLALAYSALGNTELSAYYARKAIQLSPNENEDITEIAKNGTRKYDHSYGLHFSAINQFQSDESDFSKFKLGPTLKMVFEQNKRLIAGVGVDRLSNQASTESGLYGNFEYQYESSVHKVYSCQLNATTMSNTGPQIGGMIQMRSKVSAITLDSRLTSEIVEDSYTSIYGQNFQNKGISPLARNSIQLGIIVDDDTFDNSLYLTVGSQETSHSSPQLLYKISTHSEYRISNDEAEFGGGLNVNYNHIDNKISSDDDQSWVDFNNKSYFTPEHHLILNPYGYYKLNLMRQNYLKTALGPLMEYIKYAHDSQSPKKFVLGFNGYTLLSLSNADLDWATDGKLLYHKVSDSGLRLSLSVGINHAF
ncbi:MAG: tetratricopeptide repeat protein [Proteobacteria bacterium]|nr:tetratricopeptide repeat protein [Pseudomonadota bacterium]